MIGVTGSTGLIGSKIFSFLESKGLPVRPFDLRLGQDLRNEFDRKTFLKGLDTLIHFAWKNNPRTSQDKALEELHFNLEPTLRLFGDFAIENPMGHIIFASSGSLYGFGDQKTPFKESDPLELTSNYGVTKAAVENYLKILTSQSGLKGTVLRISNPYGEILGVERGQGVIGVALGCALNGPTFQLFGSPQTTRDYIHLDDLANAFLNVVQMNHRNENFEIFNVGSGVGITTQEILNLVSQATQNKLRVNEVSTTFDPGWTILDCSKIYKNLNWKSKIGIQEGIQKMISKELKR